MLLGAVSGFAAHSVADEGALSFGVDTLLSDSLSQAKKEAAEAEQAILEAALRVLSDLSRQRWEIRVRGDLIEVRSPVGVRRDPSAEKQRVRHQELVKRDEQLGQGSVRKFIKDMERSRLHGDRFVSVVSLMRDGRELAARLAPTLALPVEVRAAALSEVIAPYLQFVSASGRCKHTGLRLQDIWRYFRHTWVNQYTSVPGRTMLFLVRDAAAEHHAVIGIGAIGSPIVQMKERDLWIGWHPDAFLEHLEDNPTPEIGAWLLRTTARAIDELHHDDFIEEQLLAVGELRAPTIETIDRLVEHGKEQRRLHHRFVQSEDHKRSASRRPSDTAEHWAGRAATHLFRSKRALTLAEMLRARLVLQSFLGDAPTASGLRTLADDKEGRHAIRRVVRKAKSERVGIAMADITVCGAVQPYNSLLGGKLVSMLSVSPEVVEAYRHRYRAAESEIASAMAAKPIIRPPNLVFMGTTSLYGIGSSQYNRLRLPAERLGGRPGEELRFLELGRSEAFGTSHFSDATVKSLVQLIRQGKTGQRVNSIFGEGVSPKMRKVRQGLEALGLSADALLRHGRHRIVYGIPLARNLREYLLGIDDEPDYLLTASGREATAEVARWWRERWLAHRIEREGILERVRLHTLIRPIRHGARVTLPPEQDAQESLFDDLD